MVYHHCCHDCARCLGMIFDKICMMRTPSRRKAQGSTKKHKKARKSTKKAQKKAQKSTKKHEQRADGMRAHETCSRAHTCSQMFLRTFVLLRFMLRRTRVLITPLLTLLLREPFDSLPAFATRKAAPDHSFDPTPVVNLKS